MICEQWPKLSIVTPSFNQDQFLEETIQSVLHQDYPNLEYIIIDGDSTDDSAAIIERYANQLAYWVSEPDRGQGHALNKGFQKVTGDLVGWINSDDVYYSPNVFSQVVTWFQKHPDLDACYGHNLYIDANGALLFCRKANPFYSERLLQIWNFINQPTVFFRRRVLDTCEVSEEYHYCLDYDFWLQMSETYRFGCSNILTAAARWYSSCKTVGDAPKMLRETEAMLRSRGLPVRHLQISRKIAYSLLRLYGMTMLLNAKKDLQSQAMFNLGVTDCHRIWTRQLIGISIDRLLWGVR
jgi:glycosyltransferase involved in cell wall biosynthesis